MRHFTSAASLGGDGACICMGAGAGAKAAGKGAVGCESSGSGTLKSIAIEGAIEGDRGVTGQLIPAQGNPVPFTFAGTDLKSVDFRLIVHPSGESRGARAARDNAHGFQLWEKST